MKMPEHTILAGEFHVAVQGSFQSRTFPYRTEGNVNYNHPYAPLRDKAFVKARALYRKLKKEHPDREFRLMDFPVAEFFP